MSWKMVSASVTGLLFASISGSLNAQTLISQVRAQAQLQGVAPLKRSLTSPTTTFHGDMRRSGHYKNWTGPRAENSQWQIPLSPSSGFGYAQPVIGQNGTIYVKDLADVLYAVSSSGNVLWQEDLGTGSVGGGFPPADSTVTIYNEKVSVGGGLFTFKERLLVTSGDAKLWKLAANGSTLWSLQLPRVTSSCSVAVRDNGWIYVTSHDIAPPFDGTMTAIDQDGNFIWQFDTPGKPAINGAPSLDPFGNVTVNGFSHATKYDGLGSGELYDFVAGFHIYGSIAQDTVGRAYFGAGDGQLYSVEASGSLRWALSLNAFITSTPAVTSNGRIVCGTWDGNVHAADADGNLLWSFPSQGPVESSPIVDAQGYVYFVSTDGELYCLDPNGNAVFTATVGAGTISTLAPGKNGRLYAVSAAGDLIAFQP